MALASRTKPRRTEEYIALMQTTRCVCAGCHIQLGVHEAGLVAFSVPRGPALAAAERCAIDFQRVE